MHMDYQLKESQHQRLFSLQSQLKQGEQSNMMAQSDMHKKQNELGCLKDQVARLNENLHQKTVIMDDTSMKFEIARSESMRN